MPTWWLWRAPKSGPKVRQTLELPWSYVRPDRSPDDADFASVMYSDVLPAIRRSGGGETYTRMHQGDMFVVKIKQQGRGGQTFWLTPPLTKFADLTEFYPDDFRVKYGHPEFWIQPEVFQQTGDIYQGTIDNLIPISFADVQDHATTHESGGFIIAALDSFLQKGAADSAFLRKRNQHSRRKLLESQKARRGTAPGHKPKRRAAQLDRDIAEALARPVHRQRRTG